MTTRRRRPRNQTISAFVETAKKYGALIENHSRISTTDFLREASVLLAQLYASASSLPTLKLLGEFREPEQTTKQWNKLFMSLSRKIGRHAIYWMVFDPYSEDKPVAGSLADDLADIYRDLRPVLAASSEGGKARVETALWTCEFLFRDHWGRHAVGALKALQELQSRREI